MHMQDFRNAVVSPIVPQITPDLLKIYLLLYENLHLETSRDQLQNWMRASGISRLSPLKLRIGDRVSAVAYDVNPCENQAFLDAAWMDDSVIIPESIRALAFFEMLTTLTEAPGFKDWRAEQYRQIGKLPSEIGPIGTDWPGDLPALMATPGIIPLLQMTRTRTWSALAACLHHNAHFAGLNTDVAKVITSVGSDGRARGLHLKGSDVLLYLLKEFVTVATGFSGPTDKRKRSLDWADVLLRGGEAIRSGVCDLLLKILSLAETPPFVFGKSDIRNVLDREIADLLRHLDLHVLRKALVDTAANLPVLPSLVPNPVGLWQMVQSLRTTAHMRRDHAWFLYWEILPEISDVFSTAVVKEPLGWKVADLADDRVYCTDWVWIRNRRTNVVHIHKCRLIRRFRREEVEFIADYNLPSMRGWPRCELCLGNRRKRA